MYDCKLFYIDGQWVRPARTDTLDVLDPATERPVGVISLGSRTDVDAAIRAARRLLSGMVHLNGAPEDFAAPFGGYKMSGNGREFSRFGFEDFLETKAVMGYEAA